MAATLDKFEIGDRVAFTYSRAKKPPQGIIKGVLRKHELPQEWHYSVLWDKPVPIRGNFANYTWRDYLSRPAEANLRGCAAYDLKLIKKKISSLGEFMRDKLINRSKVSISDALEELGVA